MRNLEKSGLLEVAMEIVGGHSNGLGEGVLTTIDDTLRAHSSWHRTYSAKPMLDVVALVALVDRGSRESRNLDGNPFTEWMFAGMDRSVCVHLVGSSRVLENLDELEDTGLSGDSVMKWEARSMFRGNPFAIHTRVSTVEVEIPERAFYKEFGREEIQGYVQALLQDRGASRLGVALDKESGFAPTGWGLCSRKIKTPVAAGS